MNKKFIWIPSSIIIGVVLWYFLKLKIYDIEVPESPAVKYRWESAWLLQSYPDKVFIYPEYSDFIKEKSDSITWPKGVKPEPVKTDTGSVGMYLHWPEGTLPLQIAKVWIKGFPYTKVLRWMPANGADTVYPWDVNYDLYLEHTDPNSKTKNAELYKENFEENKIVLTLEKPNPVKIVALWENYAITGETDGKTVKITVPRIATKWAESLVRVWVCDSSHVSRTCEIPLKYGIIPTKIKMENPKQGGMITDRVLVFYDLIGLHSGLKADEKFVIKLDRKLTDIMLDESMVPVIAYGDVRALRINEKITAIMANYFGRKIVIISNSGKKAEAVNVPFKGEIKKCYEGLNFNQKGAGLQATIPANDYAIFY